MTASREREYHNTHPWISFQLDLRHADPRLWVLLGQIVAFGEFVSRALLPPKVASEMARIYLAKGVQATVAIEGNTLSEEEVLAQIDDQLELPASKEYLGRGGQERRGRGQRDREAHPPRGCPAGHRGVRGGLQRPHSHGTFRGAWGTKWSQDGSASIPSEWAVTGALPLRTANTCWTGWGTGWRGFHRSRSWVANRTITLRRVSCGPCWHISTSPGSTPSAMATGERPGSLSYPSWRACSHSYRRSSRATTTTTRAPAYYRELARSSQANQRRGDPVAFLLYALQGLSDGLRAQGTAVTRVHHEIGWRDFVYRRFDEEELSSAMLRRRQLLLELPPVSDPIPKEQIPIHSMKLAHSYARLNPKTLDRDLSWLLEEGLVVRSQGGYAANRDLMQAFVVPAVPKRRS